MTIRKKGRSAASKRGTTKRPRKEARDPRGYGAIPPKESQRISLQDAIELTTRYRKAAPASEHAGFFWAEGLRELLAQPGCAGMRYYHGLGADGAYRMVLVGVDAAGNDITATTSSKRSKASATGATGSGGGAVLLDNHFPCPPYCPPDSPLL